MFSGPLQLGVEACRLVGLDPDQLSLQAPFSDGFAGANGLLANGSVTSARWVGAPPLVSDGMLADKPPCPGSERPATPASSGPSFREQPAIPGRVRILRGCFKQTADSDHHTLGEHQNLLSDLWIA
jgi:hypothetical protein